MAQLDALPRELAHWTAASTSQYTHTHTQYTPTSTSHSHSQYAPPPHHGGHNHTPMTPPHTDAVEPRRLAPGWGVAQTHLQTQSYTGGAGHRGQLLTPPDDTPPLSEPQSNGYYVPPPQSSSALTSTSTSSTATLPSSSTTTSSSSSTAVPAPAAPTEETEEPLAWAASWLPLSGRGRESAALVAEKTCEMICYLWFAPSVPGATASSTASNSNSTSSGGASSGEGNKDGKENGGGRTTPSPLQLAASPTFVSFTQKLLETTQVSQSVIILALHYIHRLRLRNLATPAQPGSEFRVAVAGLMMGNKYLDDNTYTNATWAAVSLIPLAQINTMEREFLVGCDYSLFVSQKTYEDWGRLLKGLVGARARAAGRHTRHRGGRLHPAPSHHLSSHSASHHRDSTTRRLTQAPQQREREREREREPQRRRMSVSPPRSVNTKKGDEGMELDSHASSYDRRETDYERRQQEDRERAEASAAAGSKRRAAAAFSPGSYHPPPHANPFAAVHAAHGYANSTQQQQQQVYASHAQRPAPTLVIPRFSSAGSTPQQQGRGSNANVNANATSNSNYDSNTTSSYASTTTTTSASYSSASSSSSSSGGGPPGYPSVSGYPRSAGPHAHSPVLRNAFLNPGGAGGGIGTPLERFGAMSLSGSNSNNASNANSNSSGGGLSGGEVRTRPRPVSYAGPSSSTASSFSASMFGAGGSGATTTFTPYAERERERERERGERERERGRSVYGAGGGTPARSASYVNVSVNVNVNYGGGATPFTAVGARSSAPAQPQPQQQQQQGYEYVPPPPSTVVQYPPQYAAQIAASTSGSQHHQQQQQTTHLPTPVSSSSPYAHAYHPHSHSTTSLHASPYGRYSRAGTPPPPSASSSSTATSSSTTTSTTSSTASTVTANGYAGSQGQYPPHTLTARWDYANAGHGGVVSQPQDLYFYALASSPVSSVSSGDSSADSQAHSRPNGHARTASYSSEDSSYSSDDDGDAEMADVEADDWEGGESDEDEDDDDSGRSDDGRGGAGLEMAARRETNVSLTRKGWDENVGDAREAARRARLRCVGAPPQMVPSMAMAGNANASRYHPLPHHQLPASQLAPAHHQFLPSSSSTSQLQQNGFGLAPPTVGVMPAQNYGAAARWGVQSARTSPVRGASSWTPPQAHAGLPRLPHSLSHSHAQHADAHNGGRGAEQWTPPRAQGMQQWTPPRMGHGATSGYGGSEWTPPRVALPRFADLERWSSAQVVQGTPCPPMQVVSGQTQTQTQTQTRETHPHQPRRAVFANAGPPGVSGYAYAY